MTTIEIEGPYYKWEGGGCFEEAEALSEMLATDGVLFIGGRSGPFFGPAEGETDDGHAAIYVSCNDTFYWACADAEPLPMGEIQELYDMWKADSRYGTTKWACRKRNLAPQVPIVKAMKNAGVWDDEMEALPKPSPS